MGENLANNIDVVISVEWEDEIPAERDWVAISTTFFAILITAWLFWMI